MKKELIYVFFVLLLFYAIHGFPMTAESFSEASTTVLNFHDTYFVIDTEYYLCITLSCILSTAYLIRVFVTKFKIKYANFMYIIFNGLFIVSLIYTIQFLNTILKQSPEESLAANKDFYTFFYVTTALLLFAVIMEIIVLLKLRKRR